MSEPASQAQNTEKKRLSLKETLSESSHEISIQGKRIKYKAIAQSILIKDELQEPRGAIFTIAYLKQSAADSKRPLMFVFNGGPGSGSVWLHLGAFGPKRVHLDSDRSASAPPYRLTPNEFSLLDEVDLVFIDPIGTGFSQAASDEEQKKFLTVNKDIESIGEIIRLFISKYGRWTSPLYLAGESYGTTRAAGLVDWLQSRHGIYFNGVLLISCLLDFQTVVETPNHYLPQVLMFPSYALTSWFHGKTASKYKKLKLEAYKKAVEEFVTNHYQPTLFTGIELAEKKRNQLAQDLSEFTGLSVKDILNWNLKIPLLGYTSKVFESERKGVGRLDSRFLGEEPDYLAAPTGYRDPSYFALQGPYSACINDYLRKELKVESEHPYEILNLDVNKNWKWEAENSFLDVSVRLKSAMSQNPHLKVLVANGYYDFATPYFAALHNFRHLDLPKEIRTNVSYSFYEAGHMMYVHLPSLKKLRADILDWIKP